jgi:UDP-glucose 4-epimerase
MANQREVVLITGMAGGLAQLVGAELAKRGKEIVGVDYRAVPGPLPFPCTLYQANYNKTRIEDAFRRHQPARVLHLGRVGNLKETSRKRFDLNVLGSRKLLDLCCKYKVGRLLVLSTFHIYGAHPSNHIPVYEDEPLRAGMDFPQIADAIQLDNQAMLWIHSHPAVKTVLLRPTNVVGPHLRNAISSFLRLPTLPVMIGFDPMVQFIHEHDLTAAICAAAESDATGVFNLSGAPPMPWRVALRMTGATLVPVPAIMAAGYLRLSSVFGPTFPPYLINFFKYPCIIADHAFRETFRWSHQVGEVECIRSTVGRLWETAAEGSR